MLRCYRPRITPTAKLEGRSVKIGCLASLTGKGAEWGQAAKVSMEIAVEEINAKGGIGGVPIELICYDTQTLEAEALKAISRLVDRDKVLAISGPCFSWRVRDHRAAARRALQDGDQLLLLGQARPFGHEQVGVPQHADQRQAAQAGGRCLGQGIQDRRRSSSSMTPRTRSPRAKAPACCRRCSRSTASRCWTR